MLAPMAAHDAVGAVAAEDVVGVDDMLSPVGAVDEGDPDTAIAIVGDVGDLDVAPQFCARVALEVGAQQRLELRLVEHVGLREAVHAAGGVAVEFGQHPHRRGRAAAGRSAGREIAANSSAMPSGRRCGRSRRRDARRAAAGTRSRHRSRTRHSMPYCASSVAAVTPVGPAPTMTTGTVAAPSVTRISQRCAGCPRSMAPSSVATLSLHDVAVPEVLGVLGLPLEEGLPLHAGGSSEPMISTGFGGALSAVPTGVPVSTRSPAVELAGSGPAPAVPAAAGRSCRRRRACPDAPRR